MNLKEITFTNDYTGQYKTAPVGFSWTTLFFGCFPAIFRSDWKWAAIQFLLALFTAGISCLIMPFFYNKLYIKDFLNKGFIPTDENQANYLIAKGIVSKQGIEFLNKRRENIIK